MEPAEYLTKGVDVRPAVTFFRMVLDLRGAELFCGAHKLREADGVGETKVYYLYVVTYLRHHDILWLQISVNDV